jgi:diguanylate cyclase
MSSRLYPRLWGLRVAVENIAAILVSVVLICVVIGTSLFLDHSIEDRAYKENFTRLDNDTLKLATDINSRLSTLSLARKAVVDHIREGLRSNRANSGLGTLHSYLTDIAQDLPDLRTIIILDPAGVVTDDLRPGQPAVGIDVSDRAYFLAHADEDTHSDFISEPVISRVDGKWSWPISLAVRSDDGSLVAVVVSSVDERFFGQMLEYSTALGQLDRLIVHRNGTVLQASSELEPRMGQEISNSSLIDSLNSDILVSSSQGPGPFDRSNLVTSFAKVEGWPLFAVNMIDRGLLTERAAVSKTLIYSFAGTLCIFFCLAALVQVRHNIRKSAITEELIESELRYRETVEGTNDLITITDKDGCFLFVNYMARPIFGLSVEDCKGLLAFDFVHADDRERTKKAFQGWIEGKKRNAVFENRQTSLSGDIRYISWNIAIHYDDAGDVTTVNSIGRDVTEQKKVAELNARLARIVETSSNEVYVVDAKTLKFLQVNASACRNLGYTMAELAELTPLDVTEYSPDSLARLIAPLRSGEKVHVRLEARHRRADGSLYDADVKLQQIGPMDRQVFAAIVEDITERKQADIALQETQKNLKEAQRIARVGSWQLDLVSNRVVWSEELYSMLGWNPQSPPPDFIESENLFTAESWARLSGAISRAGEAGNPYELELEMVRRDGSHGWMLGRGEAIRNENGSTVAIHGVAVDITERRQAEAENRKLSRAVEQSGSLVVITDPEGTIEYVNPKLAETSGYTVEELIGQNARIWQPRQIPDEDYEKLWNAIKSGRDWKHEALNRRKDGSLYWITSTISPMTNPEGKIVNFIGVQEDITERRQSEAKIHEQKLQLDTAIGNMTQGLLMFDADENLLLWNNRFLEIFNIPSSVVEKGATLLELVELGEKQGDFPGDPEAFRQNHRAPLAEGKPWTTILELPDGRTIELIHRPMDSGGWVSTHEDITERVRAESAIRERVKELAGLYALSEILNEWGRSIDEAMAEAVEVLPPAWQYPEITCARITIGDVAYSTENFKETPWRQASGIVVDRKREGLVEVYYLEEKPKLDEGPFLKEERALIEDIATKIGANIQHLRDEINLSEQKLQLDAAVDNMTQGLVMFDANKRLVLSNNRYIEMYGLSPDIVKLGCSQVDLLKHRKDVGNFSDDPDAYSHYVVARSGEGTSWSSEHELADGRIIHITHNPMAGGGHVSTHEDITEMRRAQSQIEYLAHHDTLTALPNRRSFNAFLSTALEKAARQQSKIGVFSVDLDRLTEVNDVFGHARGDLLLQEVAMRFKSVAKGAFVARLSGDEFKFVLADGNLPTSAAQLAESLQSAVAKDVDLDGNIVVPSVSIGVAIYPDDGEDAGVLLANGDAALHRAKSEGRNRICFFEASMDAELRRRRLLQQELTSAVENHELTLAYQPQSRTNGEITGFEALVRWHHPERGMIGPDLFIPLAEDSGLILELGEWVLREACREAASWSKAFLIAVNISSVQFKQGDLPALVKTILEETGLAPERLELEITETALVDDFTRAVSITRRIKELGVKIAMDDFGTGYSSLSYLQSFPFDKIKIDQSFVARLDENPQSPAIIRAIVGLAHSLSVPTLAEGVETKEQLAFLAQEGCDEVQGFLIGRPKDIDKYAKIVGRAARSA